MCALRWLLLPRKKYIPHKTTGHHIQSAPSMHTICTIIMNIATVSLKIQGLTVNVCSKIIKRGSELAFVYSNTSIETLLVESRAHITWNKLNKHMTQWPSRQQLIYSFNVFLISRNRVYCKVWMAAAVMHAAQSNIGHCSY